MAISNGQPALQQAPNGALCALISVAAS